MPISNDVLQGMKEMPEDFAEKLQAALSKNSSDNLDQLKASSANELKSGAYQKMPAYIGTKVVCAMPMDEITFKNRYKNITVDGETQPGYLVEYEDGYKSWSPKETFERAYRLITSAEKRLI